MQLKPKNGRKEETGSADGRAEAVNERGDHEAT